MKKAWVISLFAVLASLPALGQTAAFNGNCTEGGIPSLTSGLPSSNRLLGVIPHCTVTVYLTGTTTLATIYSDANNTTLTNPFTATPVYLPNSGSWLFYAATGQGYDVVMSGGDPPLTYTSPVTLTDLIIESGGGGSSFTMAVNGAPLILLGSANLINSPSITVTNPSTNQVQFTLTNPGCSAMGAAGVLQASNGTSGCEALDASYGIVLGNTFQFGVSAPRGFFVDADVANGISLTSNGSTTETSSLGLELIDGMGSGTYPGSFEIVEDGQGGSSWIDHGGGIDIQSLPVNYPSVADGGGWTVTNNGGWLEESTERGSTSDFGFTIENATNPDTLPAGFPGEYGMNLSDNTADGIYIDEAGTGQISLAANAINLHALADTDVTINTEAVCTHSNGQCATGSLSGGALGSLPYQSAANTTAFIASPTTSGHAFVPMWNPTGAIIAPTAVDLGTYLGTNVTGTSPITVTPSTLGFAISCATCATSATGTTVAVNGGSTLGSLNINGTTPTADSSYLALLPKISGANMIIEAPYATGAAFGVMEGDASTITMTAGVASCTTATSSQIGCVKPDGTIITDTAGAITVPKTSSSVFGVAKVDGTTITASAGVISATASISGGTSGEVAIFGGTTSITSAIPLGTTGSDIPQLSSGLLNASVIPDNAANTTGYAAGLAGGALGSLPYQSAANTTLFVASPTTSGHAFVPMWQPSGSALAPTAVDLGTYIGTNVTASLPIVATPSTLGTALSCPTCGSSSGGTAVTVNSGSALASLNINASAPLPDSGYQALTPKISGGNMIIEGSLENLGYSPFVVANQTGADFCAKLATALTAANSLYGSYKGTFDARGFSSAQTCSANPLASVPSTGEAGILILMPPVHVTTNATWVTSANDVVIRCTGDGGSSGLFAGSSLTTSPILSFGSGSNTSPAGNERVENCRLDANANVTGTVALFTNTAEGSGLIQSQVNGGNSASATSDLVSCVNCSNMLFQDDTFLAAGANNGLSFTYNSGIDGTPQEGNLVIRATFNNTGSHNGLAGVFFGTSTNQAWGTVVQEHSEGFVNALNISSGNSISVVGIDTTGTVTTTVVNVASGAQVDSSMIRDNGSATNLLTDGNISRSFTTAGNTFAGHALLNSYKSKGAITGGSIDGAIIGATVPAAGSFTALTATSISGLTTPLSPSQGGTGSAGLTGYVYGNGSSIMTAATTIPGSAITGNIPGNAANLYGTPTLPTGTKAATGTLGENDTNVATNAQVYNATTGAGVPHVLCSGTITLSGTVNFASTAAVGSATCTGLTSANVVIATFNGNIFTVGGFIPSTNGVLSVSIVPSTNTITVNAENNTTSSQTIGSSPAAVLNYLVIH